MNVFIVTDMEGCAGCTAGGYGRKLPPGVGAQYLALMMGEINAAVEGCVQGGAKGIIVGEAHPVDLAALHPAAKLARGIPWQECFKLRKFDAVLFVGQHARSNLADGVRSHTGSSNSIIEFKINGQPVGELALFGGLAGALGVPVVFLAGDSKACEEARALIDGPVVTAPVMESHNVHGAVCLAPAQVHKLIKDGVRVALGRVQDIRPIVFKLPCTFTIEFKYAAIADDYCLMPGTRRVDARTVSYTADDYFTAYRGGYAVLGSVLAKYDAG